MTSDEQVSILFQYKKLLPVRNYVLPCNTLRMLAISMPYTKIP